MKTILVTGSKGFIATNLLLKLNSLYGNDLKLVGIDNDSACSDNEVFTADFCHHNNVDLRSHDDLKSFFSACTYKFDLVIHLAAAGNVVNSVASPLNNFESNVIATINLLENMRNHSIKNIIFSSTGGALMGNTPPPVTENSLPSPISPYGASKASCENYIKAYSECYQMRSVILRFGNVYGKYSAHKKGVINHWLKACLTNQAITIYGDGSSTRDYVYVSDLTAGICKAYEFLLPRDNSIYTSSCETFHLSTGKPTSLNALKNSIELILNIDLQTNYVDSRSGEVEKNFADFSKAQKLLDYNPEYTLDQGLCDMIGWFRSNCISLNIEK